LARALPLTAAQRHLLQAAARTAPDSLSAELSSSSVARIPIPPTALIGREHERTQALNLLRRSTTRLLTLTGPGGVGKTRLALELAHAVSPEFADGAVFVALAAIRDAAWVPAVLAQSLGLREQKNVSQRDQLAAFLRNKRCLLVLDNVEQITDCAPFLADLLTKCPHLAMLLTSRSPLRLRAEQVLPLSPLSLDAAVGLFCERAASVRPSQPCAHDQAETICQRLDCLPLAIELVAMHVKVFSLPELAERLDHRLGLLSSGARDLPPRQQTMAHAIAWSDELLTEDQRRCFHTLGVFEGWWTLAAAEAVWRDEGIHLEGDAIDVLSALVDASLVQVENQPSGVTNFSLLQVIRDYALQCLRDSGRELHARRRHAAYYAGLAESASHFFGAEEGGRGADLIANQELPNARAALQWAEESQDAELGLRLCGFARLWYIRGQMREAEYWTVRMLALDQQARLTGKPAAPAPLRVERLYGLGRLLLGAGNAERARAVAHESLQLAQQIEDLSGISGAYATLGLIAQASGRLDEAAAAYAESYAYAARSEQTGMMSRALVNLAEIARLQGDVMRADPLLAEALACAESAGMHWDIALITTLLGRLAHQQQNFALANARYRESLRRFHAFDSPTYTAWCLEAQAVTLCAEGKYPQAARLLAGAAALREQAQAPLPPAEREVIAQAVAAVKEALAEQTFSREWLAGSALGVDEVVAYALSPVCA
jgi:predicted ATPase